VSGSARLALAFEDGPDHLSTPRFLRVLERYEVRATFFVLGVQLTRDRGLVREMAASGHEFAVHGWDHRPLLLRGAAGVCDGLARTRDLIEETTGSPVRWFRPPAGVLTRAVRRSCRTLGLVPVQPERSTAFTPAAPQVRMVRLRDADHDGARIGSWQPSLAALTSLLETCQEHAVAIGPLQDLGVSRRTRRTAT
jgi:peptidoglycan/xylan/chitin deacetylase (PgdA/CDA1 family)